MRRPRRFVMTARGERRPAVTRIKVSVDLSSIGIPLGTCGAVDQIIKGGRYVIRFDDPQIKDTTLTMDEFVIISETPARRLKSGALKR